MKASINGREVEVVGDPVRLTRRDRAMKVAALHELRRGILERSDESPRAAPGAGDVSIHFDFFTVEGLESRVFRARLALLIRAVLRADSGDVGPRRPVCPGCRAPGYMSGRRRVSDCSCRVLGWLVATAPYVPLWERAKSEGQA